MATDTVKNLSDECFRCEPKFPRGTDHSSDIRRSDSLLDEAAVFPFDVVDRASVEFADTDRHFVAFVVNHQRTYQSVKFLRFRLRG